MRLLTINQFANSLVEGHKNSDPRFITRGIPQGANAPYERIFSCTYGGRRRFPKGSQAQRPCGLFLDRDGSMSVRHQASSPFVGGLNPHKEPKNENHPHPRTHTHNLHTFKSSGFHRGHQRRSAEGLTMNVIQNIPQAMFAEPNYFDLKFFGEFYEEWRETVKAQVRSCKAAKADILKHRDVRAIMAAEIRYEFEVKKLREALLVRRDIHLTRQSVRNVYLSQIRESK